MNEKKDKWEQLTEIPQDYEVNPDLIKKAESAMRQERRTHRRNMHVWQTVAGSLAACCLLLIMIPAFRSLGNGPITPPDSSSSSTEERYFDDGSIIKETADITEVVEINELDIRYFTDKSVKTQVAKIKETDELAIVLQDMFYIDMQACYMDTVTLMISLKPNDKFEAFVLYENLSENMSVSDIAVQYSVQKEKKKKLGQNLSMKVFRII